MSVKNVRFVWNDDLHTLVRQAAFARGITMASFVESAVREAAVGPKGEPGPAGHPGIRGEPRSAAPGHRVAEEFQPRPVRDFSKTMQVKAKK